MKKVLSLTLLFLAVVMLMTACGAKGTQDMVLEALSLDVSGGSEVSHVDTHSGNGDGTSCIAFRFKNDAVLTEIQENQEWSSFPLDETVQALVYGVENETSKYGPYLTDDDGEPLVPEIRNGYYLLIDRQIKNGKAPEADILHRYSFNFDLGLYDTDTNTLYFCQLDT